MFDREKPILIPDLELRLQARRLENPNWIQEIMDYKTAVRAYNVCFDCKLVFTRPYFLAKHRKEVHLEEETKNEPEAKPVCIHRPARKDFPFTVRLQRIFAHRTWAQKCSHAA